MLVPAAADNVIRLLPPLIADEDVIDEAVTRIDRACAAIERELGQPLKQGATA
jgi:acetylornithine/N-succinyldiaminopimelate aminotransferase